MIPRLQSFINGDYIQIGGDILERKSENMYFLARVKSGFKTRAGAADRLNVSYDSLADYETGVTVPNEDIVFAMAEVYKNQMLIVEHLMQTRTGKFLRERFGLDFEVGELTRATLGFVNCHRHVNLDRLISAVWDGQITQDELPDVECVEALTRQSNQLLWALREAEKPRGKAKTVLPDGLQRKLRYA
jgi:hypothetical protein